MALAAAALAGCHGSDGPAAIQISADQYPAAFAAAIEVSKENGLVPTLRDARSGLIETEPLIAGSWMDPWKSQAADGPGLTQDSVNFQRRRARFEFVPRTSIAATPEISPQETVVTGTPPLMQPPLGPAADLTTSREPLELRVWVVIERSYEPGVRRDTWSRRSTSTSRTPVEPGTSGENPLPAQHWTPVGRDQAMERRVLQAIAERLEPPASAANP